MRNKKGQFVKGHKVLDKWKEKSREGITLFKIGHNINNGRTPINKGNDSRKNIDCKYCSKKFKTYNSKYCSHNCYSLDRIGIIFSIETRKKLSKALNKGGCISVLGYKMICIDGKQIYEHRYNWEKEKGKISKGFVVHHIDNNKLNNSINNLKIMKMGEHTRMHNTK